MSKYQPSLSEWFELINKRSVAEKIRKEDGGKHARLEFLKKTIGLPYEESERVEAIDLFNKTPNTLDIFRRKGKKLCCIRLIPKKHNLPKLRNRGLTLNKGYSSWFLNQRIDFEEYYADICPHNENVLSSMIIVVNKDGIFGEVIAGHGFQLIHGETAGNLNFFKYDFKKWRWTGENKKVVYYVKKAINNLKVKNTKQREAISEQEGEIFSGYLGGYFEIVVLQDKKPYFNDYNRVLSKYIKTPSFDFTGVDPEKISGFVVYPGKVVGKIQKITPSDISKTKISKDSILVIENMDVRFLPLLKKAGSIITEKGTVLSHASFVVRELKIPCVVNVQNATKIFKNGDIIKFGANKGFIGSFVEVK